MDFDKTVTELNRIFDYYNYKLYNNELEKPVLIIQSNSKHKSAYGWCSVDKIWNDKTGSESYFEITISAEFLNRPLENVIATLLHEMVHLYNLQRGVQDCNRGNTYHNSVFKQVAEEHGLIIGYDKRIGWSPRKSILSKIIPYQNKSCIKRQTRQLLVSITDKSYMF